MRTFDPFIQLEIAVLLGCLALVSANDALASEVLTIRSVDGNHTASADPLGRIACRPSGGNAVEHVFYICHPQALAFSEDGEFLAASGGRNGGPAKLKVWRLSDRKQLCEITVSSGSLRQIAISRHGQFVIGVKRGRIVESWRVTDGQQQWSRTVPSSAKSVRFSTDGVMLLVQSTDGRERRLDVTNGRELPRSASRDK